jgi:hypothetical protein
MLNITDNNGTAKWEIALCFDGGRKRNVACNRESGGGRTVRWGVGSRLGTGSQPAFDSCRGLGKIQRFGGNTKGWALSWGHVDDRAFAREDDEREQ